MPPRRRTSAVVAAAADETGNDLEFFALFALDMQRVLNDEIIARFGRLRPVPLTAENLDRLRRFEADNPELRKGLYILHYDGAAVYVGKADDSLSGRLADHQWKLSARSAISMERAAFRCLYLDENWSALAHEQPLIKHLNCRWNKRGFGNHDPGRRRDTTRLRADHFDRLHPINPDVGVDAAAGQKPVLSALEELRRGLPYLFRYETRNKRPLRIYSERTVEVGQNETAASLVGKIVDSLGAGWQATFLYGYLILYRETSDYSSLSAVRIRRPEGWIAPAEPTGEAESDDDEEEESND